LTNNKPATRVSSARFLSSQQNDDANDEKYDLSSTFTKASSLSLITWLSLTQTATAAGPDWGIFEGRTGSILHPLTMGSLFGLSLYTAFLGFQWRRQRTLGDDISALKQRMPSLGSYKTIQEALASGEMVEQEAELKAAISVEEEIAALTAERKELASQGNRDRHYTQGAWIAFIGTVFAIEVSLKCYSVVDDVILWYDYSLYTHSHHTLLCICTY
jgi:hypothetical protein